MKLLGLQYYHYYAYLFLSENFSSIRSVLRSRLSTRTSNKMETNMPPHMNPKNPPRVSETQINRIRTLDRSRWLSKNSMPKCRSLKTKTNKLIRCLRPISDICPLHDRYRVKISVSARRPWEWAQVNVAFQHCFLKFSSP